MDSKCYCPSCGKLKPMADSGQKHTCKVCGWTHYKENCMGDGPDALRDMLRL